MGEALEKRYPEVRLLTNPRADYGRALRQGFLAAEGDVVVNFDVDYVDLAFLDAALDLECGATEVPPWSSPAKGAPVPMTPDGSAAGRSPRCFPLVLRRLRPDGDRTPTGMKALRRVDLAPLVDACQCGEDLFDTELILRAERAGLHVAELPVTVRDTRPPRSSIVSRGSPGR